MSERTGIGCRWINVHWETLDHVPKPPQDPELWFANTLPPSISFLSTSATRSALSQSPLSHFLIIHLPPFLPQSFVRKNGKGFWSQESLLLLSQLSVLLLLSSKKALLSSIECINAFYCLSLSFPFIFFSNNTFFLNSFFNFSICSPFTFSFYRLLAIIMYATIRWLNYATIVALSKWPFGYQKEWRMK